MSTSSRLSGGVAAGERCVDASLGAKLVINEAGVLTEPLSARREIAKMLFISVRTVDTHRAHVMRKLNLASHGQSSCSTRWRTG